jgi:hypothetical protein
LDFLSASETCFFVVTAVFLAGLVCLEVELLGGICSSSSLRWILNLLQRFLTTDFLIGGATEAHARQFLSKHVLTLNPLLAAEILGLLLTSEAQRGAELAFLLTLTTEVEAVGISGCLDLIACGVENP